MQTHNRFARARQQPSTKRSHCGSQKQRNAHKSTQAHSKQSSQHDTIETALTVRVPSAQRYSSSRVYGSRRAANHRQARFQARSTTKSLEQRHMHSETSSTAHGIHTVLAQQGRPTDARSPGSPGGSESRQRTCPPKYMKHRSPRMMEIKLRTNHKRG